MDNCSLVTDAEASTLAGKALKHDEDSPLGCPFVRPGGSMGEFTVRAFSGRGAAKDHFGELIERWFALLSQKQIKRGAHCSVRALETAIREYLAVIPGDRERRRGRCVGQRRAATRTGPPDSARELGARVLVLTDWVSRSRLR